MRLKFTKMHGLGNDFVMLDGISQRIRLSPEKIRRLADRHFGIGCDQVLVVEAPRSPDADFRYRIFNADGGEVENCGNGARCFAKFVRERRLTGKKQLTVETAAGPLKLSLLDSGEVSVDMGAPVLEPEQIPFCADRRAETYPLEVDGEVYTIGAVSMGNPHAVLLVDNVDSAPVDTLGPKIECHERFPQRVNVGFLQIQSRQKARLRVFERGVGETRACGTGACAAMVSAHLRGLVDDSLQIQLPGGTLTIHWGGPEQAVTMTGPATTVYQGQITL
ncbi:diaminopimelate epimerase [Microbulbifer thermotolerans]|uniref:Diaminopimelate epimerase n=1 Tax=Microbulbifer thermotolerans TaxID=252514 RepID=A0A143HHW7_MICTH|nr:diaminopimelate epimerase [Microbulbifer thermotolerans]AMX01318.1 diaminopimelate epimerase [Microbulbifer thermotolerans]MCX2779094.1 diaminopimelate epimerase [Microbulbifer thermotolerans]MCX2782720.1 diaminopimelate epimerase [Microbulbifer thermotolerans]MCX2795626.1 diaminopimelate epimerase [Microbulbifer thermotolerans]MCX2800188.1 diaminopimelate epimerase [Microbulbifer thermotolerans]